MATSPDLPRVGRATVELSGKTTFEGQTTLVLDATDLRQLAAAVAALVPAPDMSQLDEHIEAVMRKHGVIK